jgi:arylsulfatase A-like enzyme/NTP pyrophosphatase (non-canonical NTP hydrolase)
MVARHPHVFGGEELATAQAVRQAWERRKAAQPQAPPLLSGIAASMPALTAAYRMTQKAAGVGFDWPGAPQVLAKLDEEIAELKAATEDGGPAADRDAVAEEVGDLLFTLVNLARKLGVDPEGALARANRKFRRRFERVEEGLKARGRRLGEASLAEMDELWDAAKGEERDAAPRPSPRGRGRPLPPCRRATGAGWSGRATGLAAAASLSLALLGSAWGCAKAPGRNVLLVVVDTLRADRMSLYGYHRPTTPNLEALAREAVVFANARSQAGCTFPSINSLLTSRYPALFLRQRGESLGIPAGLPSLPEILRRHGYSTAAVSASAVVRASPSKINPVGGFGRGFQVFDESCHGKHAHCVNQRALGLAEALSEPWLLYLHYLEPHSPYRPPSHLPRRFAATPERAAGQGVRGWARRGEAGPVVRRLYYHDAGADYTAQDIAHLADLYDEEIAYFDEQFGLLLASLRQRGLLDRTLLVLAADHGEELLDHGHFGHCRAMAYDTVLRTPLVLRLPGGSPGARREVPVDNLDIVPTLLDYLGIAAGGLGLEGRSLRPLVEGDARQRRLSFATQGRHRAVIDGPHKLIFDLASGTGQLFDLAADPGETIDLAANRPGEARRLAAALRRWLEATEGTTAEGLSRAQEWEERLRAVGYL